ncbi:MAG: hypothetical protein RSE15_06300 [Flavobacterium sp.]|jgi:hypothetical protein|uniref:hypothetical protein n=1 Tax=Flavobacterium sp. TaxID=239 RepID=UPI00297A702A|nr:hypothetical protein [Flavobacterium sp.]TAF10035.1 MAG: hypothetical protein EAZ75_07040 [Flavobacteriia bacterium]WRH74427.1 MAG: hypothetical protein RSE15_06300 [Flavobacterium sp.]
MKTEKGKNLENFTKTEISKEIDKLKFDKEDLKKNVKTSIKKLQNANSDANLLLTQKNKIEKQNRILSKLIEILENQRIKEILFRKDLDIWTKKKNYYLLKEWDDLPKYKLYVFYFMIAGLIFFYTIYYVYTIFYQDGIFKLLLAYATIIAVTIFLSFFISDRIVTSFKYNFRNEKFRKSKINEFEKEFEKKNKEPKLIDYLK